MRGCFLVRIFQRVWEFLEVDQGFHGIVAGSEDPAGVIGQEEGFLVGLNGDDL